MEKRMNLGVLTVRHLSGFAIYSKQSNENSGLL